MARKKKLREKFITKNESSNFKVDDFGSRSCSVIFCSPTEAVAPATVHHYPLQKYQHGTYLNGVPSIKSIAIFYTNSEWRHKRSVPRPHLRLHESPYCCWVLTCSFWLRHWRKCAFPIFQRIIVQQLMLPTLTASATQFGQREMWMSSSFFLYICAQRANKLWKMQFNLDFYFVLLRIRLKCQSAQN